MSAYRFMAANATLPAVDDETIFDLLSNHNPKAPNQLVSQFGDRVYRLAMKILSSEEDAKDVMMETFITVLKKWPTFKRKSKFSSWIYRIAHNQALMALRRRRRHANLLPLDAELSGSGSTSAGTFVDTIPNEAPTPDLVLEQQELSGQLRQAIDSLPPKYRQIYRLKEIDGLSLREIATITKLSEPAVKTRVHRARQQLRTRLAHVR